MEGIICLKCEYIWIPKLKHPKACPRCKARVDYKNKKKLNLDQKVEITERAEEFKKKYIDNDEYNNEDYNYD